MVVSVAAYPARNFFCFYDSAKNLYGHKYFNTLVREWEKEKIDQYFKDIILALKKPVDEFYLLIFEDYFNEIRKHFVEISKKHGIKEFNIINMHQLVAIFASKFINSSSNVLWLFRCTIHELQCAIWEKNDRNELNMSTIIVERRTSSNPDLMDIDLRNLKNKLFTSTNSPTIFVIQTTQIYPETVFRSVFNGYPEIIFYNFNLYDLLHIIQNQKSYVIQPIFGRNIDIKFNESYVKSILRNCVVPFKEQYQLYANEDNFRLKIYESGCLTQTIKINKRGTIILNLEIDTNGIFYIELKRKEVNFDFLSYPTSTSTIQNKIIHNIPPKHENYDKDLNAVGIDFGGTECCAFVIRRNGPDGILTDPVTSRRTLPSYIAIDEMNYPCGQHLVNRMEIRPKYLAFDIKRFIGKELDEIAVDPFWTFEVINYCQQICLIFGENIYYKRIRSSITILSYLFKQMKNKIEEYQGETLKEVVITVPLSFTEKQKDAIIDAANLAGWVTVHLLPEPIAAIFAYTHEFGIPDKSIALLFDCGGRTTKVCVAKIFDNKIEIMANNENSFLGGNDYDKRLIIYFSSALKHKYELDVLETNKKYRIMMKCQEIKHSLSVYPDDNLFVDDFISDEDDVIPIKRKEFENMSADLIFRTKNLIVECLIKAKLRRNDITVVFQVGGGCRMPMIKQMLNEMFPNAQQQCSIHPEELIAKGAALYSYELKNTK